MTMDILAHLQTGANNTHHTLQNNVLPAPKPAGPTETEKLLLSGEQCLREGRLADALRAYANAGVSPPKDEVIKCSDWYLQEGWLTDALEAYNCIGVDPPKDKLILCGDQCLKVGLFDVAFRAYERAGDQKKLIHCGEKCLKRGLFDVAFRCYERAGVSPPAELVRRAEAVAGRLESRP